MRIEFILVLGSETKKETKNKKSCATSPVLRARSLQIHAVLARSDGELIIGDTEPNFIRWIRSEKVAKTHPTATMKIGNKNQNTLVQTIYMQCEQNNDT